MKIFKPITTESAEKFSLLEIAEKLTDVEPAMLVKIKFQNQSKRIFEISKQKFNLNLDETDLLTISEQTIFYALEKTKKQNHGIKFANSVITNSIMESFSTITMYANILMEKV